VGNVFVYIIHNLSDLAIDLGAAGIRAVICGHSHKPMIEERGGVLYVNPGSCGPRRFKLPVTVGEIMVSGSALTARIVDLDAGALTAS
jgi:predicted phosphodiesterase